jgi:hypothetical protein
MFEVARLEYYSPIFHVRDYLFSGIDSPPLTLIVRNASTVMLILSTELKLYGNTTPRLNKVGVLMEFSEGNNN